MEILSAEVAIEEFVNCVKTLISPRISVLLPQIIFNSVKVTYHQLPVSFVNWDTWLIKVTSVLKSLKQIVLKLMAKVFAQFASMEF